MLVFLQRIFHHKNISLQFEHWLTKTNEREPSDIIVCELGGDIIWGNIRTLFTSSDIMRHVIGLVLVPFDVLSAIGTMQLLQQWNVIVPIYIISILLFETI